MPPQYRADKSSLEGCILKLNRAQEHFATLNEGIEDFLESDYYTIVPDKDRHGHPVIRAKHVLQPPQGISVLIGEIAYLLRSALDNLAFELTVHHTGSSISERLAADSEFPIFKSGPAYRRGAPRKVRGMSPQARAIIERLQPYHRRKNPEARTLWQLHELTSIDKHRLPHLTVSVLARSRFGFNAAGPGPVVLRSIYVEPGPLKEDAVVARFDAHFPASANVNVNAELVTDIAFDKRSPARSVRGRSVLETLWEIGEFLQTQVVPALVPEVGAAIEFTDLRGSA